MTGTRSAWALSIPIAALGCLAAHWFAYAAAHPDPASRGRALQASGHGYLMHAPLLLAGVVTVVLVALLRESVRAARGARSAPPPAWLFAFMPAAAFTLQEHAERLLAGADPFVIRQPVFLLGLALQLPFGLLAFWLARAVLRAAQAVGEAFASEPAPRLPRPVALCVPQREVVYAPPHARAYAQRGPPRLG